VSDSAEVLGIAPDATLVEIKRAYARALKLNRPDDDAEAFARVHAAFEDCVARFKRREAGISDAPEWYDDDDSEDADAPPHDAPELHDGAPADDDATHADVLAAFKDARAAAWTQDGEASDEEGAPDEASLLVDAILAAAGSLSPWEFDAWLRADERLYDLGLKREVGDRVIGLVAYSVDELPWRTVGTIFHFFEVDSVSDPRLRRDFMAREAWLQVQGDLRFDQELRARRSRQATWADRVVFGELFDPPDRGRHLRMHLVPTLAGKLRLRYQELAAADPSRADAALSPQARDYWLPVMDLSRLHWRRVAMVLGQALLVTLPVGLLVGMADWSGFLPLWGTLAAIGFVAWLFFALSGVLRSRYAQWRLRTVGEGDAPAGANVLADRPTAIAGLGAVVALALSAVAIGSERGTTGLLVQVWMLMLMLSPTFRSPARLRWEGMLSVLATTVLAYPFLARNTDKVENAFLPVSIGAVAIGILALLLVDAAHARQTRQALADVRDAFSLPQCVLAGVAAVAAVVAWLV
jgi:hypothetical protein